MSWWLESSRGNAVDLESASDGPDEDEAKLKERELDLLRSLYPDSAKRMREGFNVPVELSEVQRSFEERALKKQRCG